jgi:hypothetical protein
MSEQPTQAVEPEDRLGMTEEQWAQFQAYTRGFGEQDEHGVDFSLLRENLHLTPSQRVEKLLRTQLWLRSSQAGGSEPDLRKMLTALHVANVRWVLIGGLALRAHVPVTVCDEVDMCYAREAENLVALAEALALFHPRLRGDVPFPFYWNVQTLRSGLNFPLATTAADVDLVAADSLPISFAALWEDSVEVALLGVPVRVAALKHLIAMKRAAGREKDRLHLLELERLRALLAEGELSKPEQ